MTEVEFSQLDAMRMAHDHLLCAVMALARGDAEVLFDEEGEQSGVRWWDPEFECWEQVLWGDLADG